MILIFEADTVLFAGVSMVAQMIIALLLLENSSQYIVVIFAISAIAGVGYSKYKKNKPRGYANQKLYKLGFLHPFTMPNIGKRKIRKKFTEKFRVLPYGFSTRFKG